MAEFLLELLSEEIPARMQVKAAEDLKRLFDEALKTVSLDSTHSEAHVTPRRLALLVDGLPLQQPDTLEERKGPKVGSPNGAIQGFLKAAGLGSLEEAEQRDSGKGVFWYAVTKKFGRPTAEILPELVGQVIAQFPWPKSMRWSPHRLIWVRPLHNIMMVLNGVGLIDRLEFGPTLSFTGTNTTLGHRFLAPHRFDVHDFAGYKAALREHKVILDRTERRGEIAAQLRHAARMEGLQIVEDAGLLEEVTGLVEWPTVHLGSIDDDFMALPPEVRATTMRANQKYFTLRYPDGTPAPRFAIVANVPGSDGGQAIIAGNERVLRARLSDARFFWDQDLKVKLADRLGALEAITFHAKLGTVGQKAKRIAKLAVEIAKMSSGASPQDAIRDPGVHDKLRGQARDDISFFDAVHTAGLLAKADLVTGMVGEFPELQGIMGGYYARAEGLPNEVATAIAEHYKPAGPGDTCPTAPVSVAVALADKLDTLVGFFAIEELPTGSRDPYALRRAALGIIRLIRENNLNLPLLPAIQAAAQAHDKSVNAGQVFGFITERLKVMLRDEGVRFDCVDAVLGPDSGDDILRIVLRAKTVQEFLKSEDGGHLLAAYRRAGNIVEIESKDGGDYLSPVQPGLLKEPAEIDLSKLLTSTLAEANNLIQGGEYNQGLLLLVPLREPIDHFFETVRVNDPDSAIRANRLKMLTAIRNTFNAIADFSKIEG